MVEDTPSPEAPIETFTPRLAWPHLRGVRGTKDGALAQAADRGGSLPYSLEAKSMSEPGARLLLSGRRRLLHAQCL